MERGEAPFAPPGLHMVALRPGARGPWSQKISNRNGVPPRDRRSPCSTPPKMRMAAVESCTQELNLALSGEGAQVIEWRTTIAEIVASRHVRGRWRAALPWRTVRLFLFRARLRGPSRIGEPPMTPHLARSGAVEA